MAEEQEVQPAEELLKGGEGDAGAEDDGASFWGEMKFGGSDDAQQGELPQQPEQPTEEGQAEKEGLPVTPQEEAPAYTSEQVVAALRRLDELKGLENQLAKIHGHIGGINSRLSESQSAKSGEKNPLAGVVEALAAEGYNEIADVIRKTLEAKPAEQQPASQQAAVDVEKLVADRLAAEQEKTKQAIEFQRQEDQRAIVLDVHPDFDQVRASKEFLAWMGTLPADKLQVVNTTWKPSEVIKMVNEFKQWRSEKVQATKNKNAQLLAAVNPKGVPSGARSAPEDDAEADAFFAELDSRR